MIHNNVEPEDELSPQQEKTLQRIAEAVERINQYKEVRVQQNHAEYINDIIGCYEHLDSAKYSQKEVDPSLYEIIKITKKD